LCGGDIIFMKPRYALEILLLSAVWGASFLMIRIAGNTFPPFWVALLRSALDANSSLGSSL
jgi:drug/metabolite transporter (DMT)-like permease